MKIYYDTETCGLCGPIVLIQYAYDDGEINLYSPWEHTIQETIELIEEFMDNTVIGFNLAYDHFHLCQMYTTLILMKDQTEYLDDCIEEYAEKEPQGRFGPCLKPTDCFDVMLHARRTEYQSTMDREDIKIKRVPTGLAYAVAAELDKRVPLKDVYFARKQDKSVRWQVTDIKNDLGDINPDFRDIVLKFAPSSALKALALDALGIEEDEILLFADIEIAKEQYPDEYGFAPYNTAVGENAWPKYIQAHINHWCYNNLARKYAKNDVVYTRGLYKYFSALAEGYDQEHARLHAKNPDPGIKDLDTGDTDSILACMVGAVRWRGFKIDVEKIKNLKQQAKDLLGKLSFNFNSPAVVKKYLMEVMNQTEKVVVAKSTKAVILEAVAKWKEATVCDCGGLDKDCKICRGEGLIQTNTDHPAATRAKEILKARHCAKEIELYDKLILAGRFHASFKVIGTLSSRMSGSDGLNAQGIKRDKRVRACFPLADEGLTLCGGDFAGFEVVLIDAVYSDPVLHEDLVSGKKIHALFGQYLFPHLDYEQIIKSKGASDPWKDFYTRSKNGVFALCYGGEAYTLSNRVGVPEDVAAEGYKRFVARYKKFGEERKRYFDMFCSMRQPKGIGTKVEWYEPADYIESLYQFRRYFTLENRICHALFDLAESPPKEWEQIKIKVVRRDREQTLCGAVRSSLFGAAFAVQAGNMRAAGNHVIQSSGAQLTKFLQCEIWEEQPTGIYAWRVQPMNIHDEIMCPMHPSIIDKVHKKVKDFIIKHSTKVPLLEIDWSNNIASWADK